MYCPDCGAETSLDLKFCRSCGLGLEKIAQSLLEQLPTKLDELQARKNKLERAGRVARNLFILATLSLCLLLIGYLFTQGQIVGALAFLGVMVFVGCGILSLFLSEKAQELEKASTKRQIQRPAGLAQNGTPGKLLKNNSHHQPRVLRSALPNCCLWKRKAGIK
jgi:hypothetical protein